MRGVSQQRGGGGAAATTSRPVARAHQPLALSLLRRCRLAKFRETSRFQVLVATSPTHCHSDPCSTDLPDAILLISHAQGPFSPHRPRSHAPRLFPPLSLLRSPRSLSHPPVHLPQITMATDSPCLPAAEARETSPHGAVSKGRPIQN